MDGEEDFFNNLLGQKKAKPREDAMDIEGEERGKDEEGFFDSLFGDGATEEGAMESEAGAEGEAPEVVAPPAEEEAEFRSDGGRTFRAVSELMNACVEKGPLSAHGRSTHMMSKKDEPIPVPDGLPEISQDGEDIPEQARPAVLTRLPRGAGQAMPPRVTPNVPVISEELMKICGEVVIGERGTVVVPHPKFPPEAMLSQTTFPLAYRMADKAIGEVNVGMPVTALLSDLEERRRNTYSRSSVEMMSEAAVANASRADMADMGIKALADFTSDVQQSNTSNVVVTRLWLMLTSDLLRAAQTSGKLAPGEVLEEVKRVLKEMPRSVNNRTYRALVARDITHGPKRNFNPPQVDPRYVMEFLFEADPNDPLQRPCRNAADGTCEGIRLAQQGVLTGDTGGPAHNGASLREWYTPPELPALAVHGLGPARRCVVCERKEYAKLYYFCAATGTNPMIVADHIVKRRSEGDPTGYPDEWCIGAMPDHCVVVGGTAGYPAEFCLPFMANDRVTGFPWATVNYLPMTFCPVTKEVQVGNRSVTLCGYVERMPGF